MPLCEYTYSRDRRTWPRGRMQIIPQEELGSDHMTIAQDTALGAQDVSPTCGGGSPSLPCRTQCSSNA
ncbi:hypothetical protein ACOMHN_056140 [Nucella lapillus]